MTDEKAIAVLPGDVAEIVSSVFDTMMNLAIRESDEPWFASEDRVTATVSLGGDWNGALVIECDRRLACRLAGRFLSMDPPDTVDADVCDVLGEIANMVGGNMKSILKRGIRLSMPVVVEGSDCRVRVCGSTLSERLTFASEDGTFWVTVLTHKEPPMEI